MNAIINMQVITLAGCGRDGCPSGKYGDKLCARCQAHLVLIATRALAHYAYPRRTNQ